MQAIKVLFIHVSLDDRLVPFRCKLSNFHSFRASYKQRNLIPAASSIRRISVNPIRHLVKFSKSCVNGPRNAATTIRLFLRNYRNIINFFKYAQMRSVRKQTRLRWLKCWKKCEKLQKQTDHVQ